MPKIIKTGTIGGRDYWIVERYRDTDGWPRSLGEQFQRLGLGLPPAEAWLCGYLDASDFDGVEYDDPRLSDLDGLASLTYSGRGIPNAEHTPTNGWWLGVDTADLHGVATTSVLDTLRALAGKIDALVGKPAASADRPRATMPNETSPARPRPWRCFDKSEGKACVVDARGVHVCDATKADAELIVEAVNALAGEDTP